MNTYTTACPRNCYRTCSLRVHVEDGRIRGIEAHPDNRATAGGVCLKGLAYWEGVTSPDRRLHPLKRRESGRFEAIGWNEALDTITGRLRGLESASPSDPFTPPVEAGPVPVSARTEWALVAFTLLSTMLVAAVVAAGIPLPRAVFIAVAVATLGLGAAHLGRKEHAFFPLLLPSGSSSLPSPTPIS